MPYKIAIHFKQPRPSLKPNARWDFGRQQTFSQIELQTFYFTSYLLSLEHKTRVRKGRYNLLIDAHLNPAKQRAVKCSLLQKQHD